MPPQLMRRRFLSEVADTDEYNWLQIRRMGTPHRTVPADAFHRPLRVLIVDDHRATADTLAMLVRAWGHDVERAYDGETGFALAVDFMPDVIFLDLIMPHMSGSLLAIKVGQLAELKDCLMIAITGSTDELRQEFCQFVGISATLIKPVLPSAVQVLLESESRQMLQLRRRAKTPTQQANSGKRLSGRRSSKGAKIPRSGLQEVLVH